MKIAKENEPIIKYSNGCYDITINGELHGVCDNDPKSFCTILEVEAYLADHPEALIPEPVPPPPSKEDLLRAEEASLLAYLAEIDAKSIRPTRKIQSYMLSELTDESRAAQIVESRKLKDLEAEAEKARVRISEIRAEL